MVLQPALPEVPLELIGADQVGVDDIEPGHGAEETGERLVQIDGNTALAEHLGAADRGEESPDPDLQGQHSVHRVLDVLGEHRSTVVKERILAHLEYIAARVVRNLVGSSQIHLQIGCARPVLQESAVEIDGLVVDPAVVGGDRIQRGWNALGQQYQVRALARRRTTQDKYDHHAGQQVRRVHGLIRILPNCLPLSENWWA